MPAMNTKVNSKTPFSLVLYHKHLRSTTSRTKFQKKQRVRQLLRSIL